MPKIADPALVDYCIQKYRAGITPSNITLETGVSNSVLYRRIRQLGIPMQRRLALPESVIVSRYLAGESPAALADSFGVSVMPIMRVLRENAVRLRTGSEANLIRASRLTPEQRKANAKAAHDAKRGCPNSFDSLVKSAQTRQRTCRIRSSDAEAILRRMLAERGIDTVPQTAIGPYNCDLGAFPVAVEVFGGKWHWHGAHLDRSGKRTRYILDAGWHMLAVRICAGDPLTEATADYVAAYVNGIRSNPPAIRQYRVVRSDGDFIAGGSAEDEDISIVSAFTNARDGATGRYTRTAK